MKSKANQDYIIIVCALVLLLLCIWFVLYSRREENKFVVSLSQLPVYGSEMPKFDDRNIEYLYIPNRGVLFCKMEASKQVYDNLCEHFKLRTVEYSHNFPEQEFDGVDPLYIPSGRSLSFGYGSLISDRRSLIRVCWEQAENTTDTSGHLYIYILDR